MRWLLDRLGRRASGPEDIAERLTKRGVFRVGRESAPLTDRDTVQAWLRELTVARDQQVFVHRPWGTVVAVADGRHPVGVFLSDGEKSYVAAAPGSPEGQDLSPEQIEAVLLDALSASGPPAWPEWRYLV
jgi:hypothetical protein